MSKRVTFDVFQTDFQKTMHESLSNYLSGLSDCSHPVEMLQHHEEFLLFTSRVYAELEDVVASALEVDHDLFH